MRLLIADDDAMVRKSLSITLSGEPDIEIVGCAENGDEAVRMCKEEVPDIILMDIRMPVADGIAATRIIKKHQTNIKIMVLTTFDDRTNIRQALAVGADGYLVKTDKISGIADKLRIMMGGSGVLDAQVLKKLTDPQESALSGLTRREWDITRLVAQGLTNKEIASYLYLSEGTIRNNIVVIMEKLNVSNRTQLGMVYYGMR